MSRTKKQKYPRRSIKYTTFFLSFGSSSWHLLTTTHGSSYRPSSSVAVVSFSPSNIGLASLFDTSTTFSLAHVRTPTDIRCSFSLSFTVCVIYRRRIETLGAFLFFLTRLLLCCCHWPGTGRSVLRLLSKRAISYKYSMTSDSLAREGDTTNEKTFHVRGERLRIIISFRNRFAAIELSTTRSSFSTSFPRTVAASADLRNLADLTLGSIGIKLVLSIEVGRCSANFSF